MSQATALHRNRALQRMRLLVAFLISAGTPCNPTAAAKSYNGHMFRLQDMLLSTSSPSIPKNLQSVPYHLCTHREHAKSYLRQQCICRGAMRTVMITGDYHYTATSVARQVGMVPANGKIVLIQAESEFTESSMSESRRGVQPVSPDFPLNSVNSFASAQPFHSFQSGNDSENAVAESASETVQQRASLNVQLSKLNSALTLSTNAQSQKLAACQPPAIGRQMNSQQSRRNGWLAQQGSLGDSRRPEQGCVSFQGHAQEGEQPLEHALAEQGEHGPLQEIPGRVTQAPRQFKGSSGLLRSAQDHGQCLNNNAQLHHHSDQGQQASGPDKSPGLPQQLCQDLRLTLEGREEGFQGESALQALKSVAQGQAHCCLTGPAFAHLLKQEDLSMLQIVMQNVVVFARMQSHQKGQVMELFGARGLHQMLDGQSRHIEVNIMQNAQTAVAGL